MVKNIKSSEIKKLLNKAYPKAKFKVRQRPCTYSSSITIYTDLIKNPYDMGLNDLDYKFRTEGTLNEKDYKRYKELKDLEENNQKISDNIKNNLLKDFWKVDRCPYSDEILSGGNTYLQVEDWENTKWLK